MMSNKAILSSCYHQDFLYHHGTFASGGITLLGSAVPHAARKLVDPGHARLLPPVAALLSTVYLRDDIARSASSRIELPTSLLSAPVWAYSLWTTRSNG